MNAATYVAELLIWSAAHLAWQAPLACALFSVWRSRCNPSAEQRHCAAIWILASLPVLFVATAIGTHLSLLINARDGAAGALSAHSARSLGKLSTAFEHAAPAVPVLIAIWCVGVASGLARVGRERGEIRRLRARLRAAPPAIVARVRQLALQAGVASNFSILDGDDTSGGPFVAGLTHPLLVLPAVDLTHEEWNAVVLHELAHVRRRDHMVSYALELLNTLLWFHPSVRMLSGWAAEAREECCDADAVRMSSAPLALARALVRIAEQECRSVRAVAATSGSLVTRLERVLAVKGEQRTGRSSVLIPLCVGCAIYAAGVGIWSAAAPSVDSMAINGAIADMLPAQHVQVNAVDPAGHFSLTEVNGRIFGATVGGVPLDLSAMHVDGRRVTMLSARGEPALTLSFDPSGGFTWNPRQPRRARTR
ncbi:MAG: M56 family metallopeptidase [Gemmatimonadota bacterium]|nr:M56 family metallopeptidase [Gemmatimonadota bacterium]